MTGIFAGCREPAEALLESELASLRTIILRAPHNESAWNYLRGLCCNLKQSAPLNYSPRDISLKVGLPAIPQSEGLLLNHNVLSYGSMSWCANTIIVCSPSKRLSTYHSMHNAPMTSWGSSACTAMCDCQNDNVVHVQVLEKCPTCGPALAFLADSCSAQKLLLTQRGNQKLAEAATAEGVRLFKALEVTDPMRAAYWQLCQAHLLNTP